MIFINRIFIAAALLLTSALASVARGAPAAQDFPLSSDMAFWPFVLILISAFLGGMILNIMPCVLPVISLKLAGMRRDMAPLSPRAQLSWTIFGIFISFFFFALIVYALQQSGQIVGWGFHFQQPVFVLFMMSVLLFFSLVQIGLLDFKSAFAVQSAAAQWLEHFQSSRPMFHVFYGGLITLLATPCTAPFLGSAVAFALTQPLIVLMAVFMAIALGLAMPWVIFLLLPDKIHLLPRTGRLMIYLKNLAGLLLYGSALWLLWVASGQLGYEIAISFFVLMNVILILSAKIKLWPVRYAALISMLMIIAAPIGLPEKNFRSLIPHFLTPLTASVQKDGLNWQKFDENMLRQQIRKGKVVFVDISADWCLTCQYNKVNVLLDKNVIDQLGKKNIYLMSGDLTRANDDITRFLYKEGRVGIPFNGLYRRGQKKIFSEVLDKTTLLEALNAFQR